MDLGSLRRESLHMLRMALTQTPTTRLAPVPAVRISEDSAFATNEPTWAEGLFYPITAPRVAPGDDSGKDCEACFHDDRDKRCIALALALFMYVTATPVTVDGTEAFADGVRLVVVYDLHGPWKDEWIERERGSFHLIVIHARTLRCVQFASARTSNFGVEYGLPANIAQILECWNQIDPVQSDEKDVLRAIVTSAVTIQQYMRNAQAAIGAPVTVPLIPPSITSIRLDEDLAIDLAMRNSLSVGTVLCMRTGTGKTLTSIRIVNKLHTERGSEERPIVVVVGPDTAYKTFQAAMNRKGAPCGWTMHWADKGFEVALTNKGDVVFVPHSILVSSVRGRLTFSEWADRLPKGDAPRLYLIVDEAHHASDEYKWDKNAHEKRTSYLFQILNKVCLVFDHRIVLSGTPFVNKDTDIRRLLSIASGVQNIDMTHLGCDRELMTRYFERLRINLIWLMNESDRMPQVKYIRHTVPMRTGVWATLCRLYSREAKGSVRKEFAFFERTNTGGAVGKNFIQRLMKSFEDIESSHDIKTAIDEAAHDDTAALVRELNELNVWDLPFYENPVWTQDVFRTQSEQFTFRETEPDATIENMRFYDQDVAMTTDDGAIPQTVIDHSDTEHASCFEWAVKFVDDCVLTKEFPIVLHVTRIDPGINVLHDVLVKHVLAKYSNDDIAPQARINENTIALITGDHAKMGLNDLQDNERCTVFDDGDNVNDTGYLRVNGTYYEFRIPAGVYDAKRELAKALETALGACVAQIDEVDEATVAYSSRCFTVTFAMAAGYETTEVHFCCFVVHCEDDDDLPDGITRRGTQSALHSLIGGVPLCNFESDGMASLKQTASNRCTSMHAVKLNTKLDQIREYFEIGAIDILLMSPIARESEFVPRVTLRPVLNIHTRNMYRNEYGIRIYTDDGDLPLHRITNHFHGDERTISVSCSHPLDHITSNGNAVTRQTFERRLEHFYTKPKSKTEAILVVQIQDTDDDAHLTQDGRLYMLNRVPPVRHFCHIGMQWSSANMRQAEARVIRRHSHPMHFDKVDGNPTWPLYGALNVHTVLTVRPTTESVFKTYDERMDELIHAKDATIYAKAHLLASHGPATCVESRIDAEDPDAP